MASIISFLMLACSVLSDFAAPRTVAQVASSSTGFFGQKYWSGLLFPPPGVLPHPGIKPMSLVANALAGRFFYHLSHVQSLGMGYKAEHPTLTLCNPMDCGPPGSSVHGILQAKILEWVAISSSRGSSQPRDSTSITCVSCMGGRSFT